MLSTSPLHPLLQLVRGPKAHLDLMLHCFLSTRLCYHHWKEATVLLLSVPYSWRQVRPKSQDVPVEAISLGASSLQDSPLQCMAPSPGLWDTSRSISALGTEWNGMWSTSGTELGPSGLERGP